MLIEVKLKGTAPLLMGAPRSLNPLDELTRKLASLAKQKKTDETIAKMQWLEWQLRLYWDEAENRPYIPAINIEACIRDGGKFERKGSAITRAFIASPDQPNIPLIYSPEKNSKAKLFESGEFLDYRAVRNSGSSRGGGVMRSRPRFDNWSLIFDGLLLEQFINFDDFKTAVKAAGQAVGLCEYRPRFGRFEVGYIREKNGEPSEV